jgi:GlpG protein
MRLIGHLTDESLARTFADFLYVQGIENHVEQEAGSSWGVWINDEDKIERATGLLSAFRENPKDAKYRREGKAATQLRDNEEQAQEAYRERVRNRRHLFRPLTAYGFGPLTFLMILASVAVFALSDFGNNQRAMMALFLTDYSGGVFNRTLPEIRHGQLWRLFTPIFYHYDIMHIVFNMLWLKDLGSMIEGRQSSIHLLVLTLLVAAGSNLAQFYLGGPWFSLGGPTFGGMSGVVYGLLGYIWIRGKMDPASGLFLHPNTVIMMMIWFFVCFTGWVGDIANAAHAGGLLIGLACGWLTSLRHR